jgi:hypothetical protein
VQQLLVPGKATEKKKSKYTTTTTTTTTPKKKKKKHKNPMQKTFKILHRKHTLLTQGEKERKKVFVYNLTGTCF